MDNFYEIKFAPILLNLKLNHHNLISVQNLLILL